MTCDILLTTEDGQILAGYFELKGGVLTAHPIKGHELLFARTVSEPNRIPGPKGYVEGVSVTAAEDPVKWFNLLPWNYTGSRVRARIINR